MRSAAAVQSEPAPIIACTVSRDVSDFDLLIEDMETELGESWGDLTFHDAQVFLGQPEADALQFIAIAVDGQDDESMNQVATIIAAAKAKHIKIILIAEDVSPIALHQLLKLGADDFVPYPLPENALHEAIERIRRAPTSTELAEYSPAARTKGDRDGMILPVHGLAGGTGATTFAVNLAWELAVSNKKNPPKVCLIDLDFQYGSVSTYLDLPRREAVYEMLSDTAKLDRDIFMQSMLTFNDRMHVLTAPADMLPLDIVQSEDITRILDMARSHFDFVVVDMPKTIVQWTEAVLHQAKVYFGVIELDMRSAQNTLRVIRALKAEDLPFEKLRYVLNRAPSFTDLTGKGRVKRLAESLDIAIEVQLPDGGKPVTQSNDHGQPLAETANKNPLRKEIAKLAVSLVNSQQKAEAAAS
ncbi:AAA family ATPase [Albidovulum sp.]|uniref:AAA family ATPase n=1 Tax=Albidovulum sp. TaxID=1872424 RepID=UPI001DF77522|nr:AAA family ATPase [Paracoccaceae bacterium]MCC0047101.1 AAA family ATPase [Defluviimonas sp.]HPE24907.1 AAA family ATPase [Albidovulum sp.]MCB2134059.1 AAA family ATPase [Paracoccaceae bacterium]MCB2143339.1 AAA family ATPase [Paracoccaceae bacterium]